MFKCLCINYMLLIGPVTSIENWNSVFFFFQWCRTDRQKTKCVLSIIAFFKTRGSKCFLPLSEILIKKFQFYEKEKRSQSCFLVSPSYYILWSIARQYKLWHQRSKINGWSHYGLMCAWFFDCFITVSINWEEKREHQWN